MRRFTPLLIIGALLVFVFIIGIIYGDSGVTNSFWNPVEPPSFNSHSQWLPVPPRGDDDPDLAQWLPVPPRGDDDPNLA